MNSRLIAVLIRGRVSPFQGSGQLSLITEILSRRRRPRRGGGLQRLVVAVAYVINAICAQKRIDRRGNVHIGGICMAMAVRTVQSITSVPVRPPSALARGRGMGAGQGLRLGGCRSWDLVRGWFLTGIYLVTASKFSSNWLINRKRIKRSFSSQLR